MVQYKLYYFPFRGTAEWARQLFALANAEYEDVRIPHEEFNAERKPEMPFGKMPVLEIDGKKYGQSGAITRYLAHTFGFAGKTPVEMLAVDAIYEQLRDYLVEIQLFFRVLGDMVEGDKDKLYKELTIPARDKMFAFCETFLSESGTGYLVGNSISYADLAVSEHVATLLEYYPDFLADHPKIEEHMKKIRSNPTLSNWIEKRPKTPF